MKKTRFSQTNTGIGDEWVEQSPITRIQHLKSPKDTAISLSKPVELAQRDPMHDIRTRVIEIINALKSYF